MKFLPLIFAAVLLSVSCSEYGRQDSGLSIGRISDMNIPAAPGEEVDLTDYVTVSGGTPPYTFSSSLSSAFTETLVKVIPEDASGILQYGIYVRDSEGNTIRCYGGEAHGEQSLEQAFANSCNGAFANLGLSLDLAGLKGLADQLLFNRELPLSLPYSKSSYQMDSGAGDWEILQTSIGQGQTLISPMHNLLIMSAIANDGVLMRPYLIDRVENASGELVKEFRPSEAAELMVPNEAAALQELLIQVVNEGTGSALKRDSYQAAGKTGSAEFETGKETHAWFVGYAPAEDPKIAVCVIVEEGGSGGGTAAPIAAELMDAWLLGE